MEAMSFTINEGTFALQGITGFGFSTEKEQRVLADPYVNILNCEAKLIISSKQDIVLHTKEFFPGSTQYYREVYFTGEITQGGQLKFSWPQTFTELNMMSGEYLVVNVGVLPEIRLHTGCALSGDSISNNTLDYKGYFNGKRLFADMHIVGLQEVPGQIPFLIEMVDGPIMINFLIDLKVSD